ncbi:MAG TPA: single-stranded DNA-binding protein [Galbitalea sp.]|jgi:single-strand DNA-binding protein|nr:single-stranded DNA-binding protein [Galbitalea sp.]
MTDNITLSGIVASQPRAVTTAEGLAITSFRLASNQRRYDKTQDKWVEGDTNWYTVSTFRQLAANAAVSINKGERVVVSGRLKVREYEAGGKKGISVEVEADALGHDLSWGTAAFSRGGGAATMDAAPAVTVPSEFPTAAELEAIVDGTSATVVDAPRTDVETPF